MNRANFFKGLPALAALICVETVSARMVNLYVHNKTKSHILARNGDKKIMIEAGKKEMVGSVKRVPEIPAGNLVGFASATVALSLQKFHQPIYISVSTTTPSYGNDLDWSVSTENGSADIDNTLEKRSKTVDDFGPYTITTVETGKAFDIIRAPDVVFTITEQ